VSTQTLDPCKVKKRGMEALTRELGASGMVQFMQQFSSGHGDYSKDRRKILDGLSVDDVWSEIKTKQKLKLDPARA
jgi:hypothetical protein